MSIHEKTGQKGEGIDLESRLKLEIASIASYEDYAHYHCSMEETNLARREEERRLVAPYSPFDIHGFYWACRSEERFFVISPGEDSLEGVPNWREQLVCRRCHLNNRLRASIHILEAEHQPRKTSPIYLTEQVTPAYGVLRSRFANLVGSEFLGDFLPKGKSTWKRIARVSWRRVRNENLACLSFRTQAFDFILSFDVFEHTPDYLMALQECFRCLRPGGTLLFSVPFNLTSYPNLIRARVTPDGEVHHLMTPEYHDDPIKKEGCLCYTNFGWELLDEVRGIGFENVSAVFYWSRRFAYLGGDCFIFSAAKPGVHENPPAQS